MYFIILIYSNIATYSLYISRIVKSCIVYNQSICYMLEYYWIFIYVYMYLYIINKNKRNRVIIYVSVRFYIDCEISPQNDTMEVEICEFH